MSNKVSEEPSRTPELVSQASPSCSEHIALLVRTLQLSADDARLLTTLADEAAARFESDSEGIVWLEAELRRHYPALWQSLSQKLIWNSAALLGGLH